MAACDFEPQDFDCSRNPTGGGGWPLSVQKVSRTTLLLSVPTKDPDRPDGHHASRSFNRLNGPADGPHPGRGEPQQLFSAHTEPVEPC